MIFASSIKQCVVESRKSTGAGFPTKESRFTVPFFVEIFVEFYEDQQIFAERLRRAQIFLALRRDIIQRARKLREGQEKREDFLDKVHNAATNLNVRQAQSVAMATALERQMAPRASTTGVLSPGRLPFGGAR